jgi:thiosulfate dehydrogenase (quinone) large subunit
MNDTLEISWMNALLTEDDRNITTAYLLLRVTIGLNILIHGASKILGGTSVFAHSLVPLFQKTPLPIWSVLCFGLALP